MSVGERCSYGELDAIVRYAGAPEFAPGGPFCCCG
jgi:hypothetical protein